MKLDYIITLNTIMENLINNVSTVTPSLKFKFLGIMRELAPYVSNFETIKNDLIMKYGTKDENGNTKVDASVDKDAFEKFKTEYEKFVKETDVQIDMSKLKLKAADVFNSGVPATYLTLLYDLIEE
jgi:hypothetical protein